MNKYLKIIVFALLLFWVSDLQSVQAATADYTPSITISKQQAIDNAGSTEQVLAPQADVSFTIERVTVAAKTGKTLDLADPTTYDLSAYQGPQPVKLTVVTNEKGQASIVGRDQLPRGFYRITEQNTTAKAFLVQLPYKMNGVIQDDLTIVPKSGLVGGDTATQTQPPAKGTAAHTTVKVATNGNAQSPTTSAPNTLDRIMQTGGAVMALPLVAIAVLLVGLTLSLFCLLLLWKRRKDKREYSK